MMVRLALAIVLPWLPLAAQKPSTAHATSKPATSTAKPGTRTVSSALKPYTSCQIPGGPDLVQTTPLPQAPMSRPAQTLTGPKTIKMIDGEMAAFAYTQGAPFANVKIELLPTASYSSEKADLISEFDAINAKGEDTQRNYSLKPTLNGFEIYGFDRTALDGNVLGIYLLFDNPRHIVTTAYFLNAPEGQRRFKNVQEYTNLRDRFLNAYTACVRKQLGGAAPAKPAVKSPAKAPVHHAHRS